MKVEYRVKPVTRYIVTRYHEIDLENADGVVRTGCGVEQRGEYDNGVVAYEVAYALCRAEHEQSDQPPGSDAFIYPSIPDGVNIPPR